MICDALRGAVCRLEAPEGRAHPSFAVVCHAPGVGARNDQSPSESDNFAFVGEVASRDAQCSRQRSEEAVGPSHRGSHVSPPIALHRLRSEHSGLVGGRRRSFVSIGDEAHAITAGAFKTNARRRGGTGSAIP